MLRLFSLFNRVAALSLLVTAGAAGDPSLPDCATCHPKEAARFGKSPMGNSLGAPASMQGGQVVHRRSGSVVTIKESDGTMTHTLFAQGSTVEYPIRYQIGAGLMGRTYVIQLGDYLFESPASWFKTYGWDVSPGYASAAALDFDRPVSADCLFCHSGNPAFAGVDRRRLAVSSLQPIGCERCHGSGEAHRRHPTSSNIVNPVTLPQAARDSVCEQCHLEGLARVLNPGKTWADFHAGEPAENVFATYIAGSNGNQLPIAVTHAEQLAQSRCSRASSGKLWCGACHDPHGETKNRPREVAQICRSCHATLSAVTHPMAQMECTSCHMPASSTIDIAHAAITDHRILRRPLERARNQPDLNPAVVAWREPAPEFRNRDLGVAEMVAAFAQRSQTLRDDAIRRLAAIPSAQQQGDAIVLSDLETLYTQDQQFEKAVAAGHRTVELQPESAATALKFGLTLKRAGKLAESERQFLRAIELDPSLKQAYAELVQLYAQQSRNGDAVKMIDRFLDWNPQDLQFRLWKSQSGSAGPGSRIVR